jgi:ABC-2 type transport system ATP-binding protein
MSKEEIAISVNKVSKTFALPHEKTTSIKSMFTNKLRRSKTIERQKALNSVDFTIKEGEFFGIVGRNGSGKSTLLKILAGIYQPTHGHVSTKGKLVPFIELGVGFNPELTGRENVYLNGALLGFNRAKIDEMYDAIVEFSELGRFMDQKLKNYSSGMQVRLAFAVATRAEADILLVDEVLAVGDADFQRKCFKHFKQLKKDKKTVVFVSHDMSAIREYCDRAILIEKSEIIKEGRVSEVASAYTKLFMSDGMKSGSESTIGKKRWGDKDATLQEVHFDKQTYRPEDTFIELKTKYKINKDVTNPIFGFAVKNSGGTVIMGTNTRFQHIDVGSLATGREGVVTWKIPNILNDGDYTIDVAITHDDTITQYDWWEDATGFTVFREEHTPFMVEPAVEIILE